MIRNNIVHDTFGEAIYLGGAGPNDGTPGSGYPSHSHITIESNIVYNAGGWGGQGDGIDVKAGICFLTIRANEIYDITNSPVKARAIVIQGQVPGASQTTLIEGNRIHDCTRIEDAAVVVVDTWGTPQGVTIRNNVIYNMNEAGIRIYNSQDTVRIYNNTFWGCGSVAILAFSQVSVMNNLAFNNNRDEAQVAFVGGTAQCDYNAYSGQWGYSPVGPSSVSLSATDLTNTVTSAATGDFTLKAGSPVIGKAKVLSGFRSDIVGRARGAFWDIGAYQHTSSNSQPPQPPTGLRIAAP